jgi:hypothetical protein
LAKINNDGVDGPAAASGLYFTNILRVHFSYESFAQSFFVLAVKVKLFICARILAQLRQ